MAAEPIDRTADGRSRRRRAAAVGGVVVAAVGVAVAVLSAHSSPPTGYEASIYRATPPAFWVGVGLAFVVGLAVALGTEEPSLRAAATVVAGSGAVAIVALPLLRGYYFHGSADSLSHLGWIRDLAAGRIGTADLFYPGIHAVAVVTADLLGIGLRRGAMLAVVAVTVGFFLAVPAATWALTGSDRAAVVGAFSAFALLPVNVVVTEMVVHPITQASLFVAAAAYLLVRYTTSDDRAAVAWPTALGALLGVVWVGLVLYHPQAALGVLVVLVGASLTQAVARRRDRESAVAELRPLYLQTLLLAIVFVAWAGYRPATINTLSTAVDTVVAIVAGRAPETGAVVTQRRASLAAVGGSLLEIFLKLFLVSAVYVGLVGVMSVRALRRPGSSERLSDGVVRIAVAGLVALGLFAVVHFVGPLSGLVYRYVAVGATVVTVLGAVALHRFAGETTGGTVALGVALACVLALSVPTVFASPYVYQPSTHVSAQQLDGYAASFETAAPGVAFVGVRWPHWRYQHAVQGTTDIAWDGAILEPAAINDSLATASENDRYIVVTEWDRKRELQVYRELRYTRANFQTIATQPGIDRVRTNGGFVLYHDAGQTDDETTVSGVDDSEG